MVFDFTTLGSMFVMVVISGSMDPAMPIGSEYTVNTQMPIDNLKEGDIIAFDLPDMSKSVNGSTAIVHRIVDIEREEEDQKIESIETQGDANEDSIDGVDLDHDIDREELEELYIGHVTLGDQLDTIKL